MATSPLYPGYKPKKPGEEPINPVYPGYYAGQALPKKPQSKDFIKPIEYNYDVLMEGIDEVGEEISGLPLAAPKWIKDRIVDDWKQQLKVSASPKVELDPTDLDDYATDDLVGATAKLSLNPKDWGIGHKDGIKQTGKQILKTLKDWSKETTGIDYNNILDSDFSDIENKARERMWLSALGYGDETYTKLEKRGGRALSDRTTVFFQDHRDKARPLDLKGVSITDDNGVVERDIYRKVATAAAEFERGMDSPRGRDKDHTNFVSTGLNTANKEIMHHYLRGSDEVKKAIGTHAGAVEFFNIKAQALETIEELQGDITSAAKTLRKVGLGKSSDTALNALQKLKDTQLKDDPTKGTKSAVKKLADLSTAAQKLSSKGIPQKEIDKFIRETTKYSTRVESIQSVVEDSISRAERGGISILGLGDIAKKIEGKTPSKNFTSRSTFKGDLGDNLRKDMERSMMSDKPHDIGSLLNDKVVESKLSSQGVSIRAKNLTPVMHRLRQDRIRYATKEVLDAYDKGGVAQVLENYAWKKMKDLAPRWVERAASGEIVGESLKRTNYFGLKVDEDYGVPQENTRKMRRFERKFGNTAKVKLDPELKTTGLGKTIKVSGKEIADGGFKGLYTHKAGDFRTLKLLDFNDKNKKTAEENRVLFAKLLNNDRSEETLNQLSQKLFGVDHSIAMKSKDSREALNKLIGYEENGQWKKGSFDKVGDWIGKKTEGKIKVQPKQRQKYVNLNKSLFGISSLTIQPGKHLDFLKNDLSYDLVKKAKNKAGTFKNFKELFYLDSELKGKTREDILKKMYFAATGRVFDPLSTDGRKYAEFSKQIKEFSEWVKNQKGTLGSKSDSITHRVNLFFAIKNKGLKEFGVNVDDKNEAFLFFTSVLRQNESMNSGYRLTDKRFMGRLERINDKMQTLKKRWEKTLLGKIVKIVSSWKDIIAEKAAAALSKLLTKILGAAAASTGVLAVIMPMLQAVVEKTIKKSLDYIGAVLKGILTLNFDDLDKLLEKDLIYFVIPCAGMFGFFGCAGLMVATVFMAIWSSISPADITLAKQDGYLPEDYMVQQEDGYNPSRNVLPATTIKKKKDPTIVTGEPILQCAGFGDSKCTEEWDGVDEFGPGLGGFFYNQKDPQWSEVSCMRNAGCFVTSLAMVSTYFGDIKTPPEIWRTNSGLSCCTVRESWLPNITTSVIASETTDLDMINWFSSNPNGLIILRVCINKGGCHLSLQHFVVITGYDADKDDFVLYDPYRAPDLCLKKEYPPQEWPWTTSLGYTKQGFKRP
jgi:hypothetical protein